MSGCKKEIMYPPCTPTEYSDNSTDYSNIHLLDGSWRLTWGVMYMENLDTGEEEEVFLFNGDPVSSLRYEGSMYNFETLVRYETIWTFNFPEEVPGMGTFCLDNDSIQPYNLYVTENNLTVCEHISGQYTLLGGSSRPMRYEVLDNLNEIINFYVQETYTNINGYNYRYYSKLRFKKL